MGATKGKAIKVPRSVLEIAIMWYRERALSHDNTAITMEDIGDKAEARISRAKAKTFRTCADELEHGLKKFDNAYQPRKKKPAS